MVAAVAHFMVHQQGKLQKHQAFEAEVQANSGAIVKLDETGNLMISEGHFASETIRVSRSNTWYGRPSGMGGHLVGGQPMWIKCQLGFLKKDFSSLFFFFRFLLILEGGGERTSSRLSAEHGG